MVYGTYTVLQAPALLIPLLRQGLFFGISLLRTIIPTEHVVIARRPSADAAIYKIALCIRHSDRSGAQHYEVEESIKKACAREGGYNQ